MGAQHHPLRLPVAPGSEAFSQLCLQGLGSPRTTREEQLQEIVMRD